MITRLAHIGLAVPDIEAARADYAALFGCTPPALQRRNNGYVLCSFPLENTALELIAGHSEAAKAHLLHVIGGKPKLTTLAWAYDDKLPMGAQEVADPVWRIPDADAAGIKTFFVKEALGKPNGAIARMDHVVLNTPNPSRAKTFYGERLGLRLALEKSVDALKAHMMFFRTGGLSLEVVHKLDQPAALDGNDTLWGLGWAVADIEAQAARLSSIGLDHSGVRDGIKSGTRVLTIKSGTQGIPTLLIQHADRKT